MTSDQRVVGSIPALPCLSCVQVLVIAWRRSLKVCGGSGAAREKHHAQ